MSLFSPPKEELSLCTKEKDTNVSGLEDVEDKLMNRFVKKHCQLISDIQKIGMPKKGEQVRIVTMKTFNAIQFIEHICEKDGGIEQLSLVVYSLNFYAGKRLVELVDAGKIKKLDILMSNLRNKAHREKEQVMKDLLINNPNITLFFCSSHAKLFSCKTKKGNHYTLEGSGNMSNNSRVEQYVLDNDQALYFFTKSWMREIKQYLKGKRELVQY